MGKMLKGLSHETSNGLFWYRYISKDLQKLQHFRVRKETSELVLRRVFHL